MSSFESVIGYSMVVRVFTDSGCLLIDLFMLENKRILSRSEVRSLSTTVGMWPNLALHLSSIQHKLREEPE